MLLVGVVVGLFALPGYKYRIGMSMKEAQMLMAKPYPVDEAAINYLNGPTASQMQNDPVYLIDVKREGVILEFSHYQKLIRIRKWWQ